MNPYNNFFCPEDGVIYSAAHFGGPPKTTDKMYTQLTNPQTVASMLAPSPHKIVREDGKHQTTPGSMVRCRRYRTEAPPPVQQTPPIVVGYNPASFHGHAFPKPVMAHYQYASEIPSQFPAAMPETSMVFTHGEVSDLDEPELDSFAFGFARHHTILIFQNTAELGFRTATFPFLFDQGTAALGGRGIGGHAAVRSSPYNSIRSLILINYPLLNKIGPLGARTELLWLDPRDKVLFIAFDSNTSCPEDLLASVRKEMRSKSWFINVREGDSPFLFPGGPKTQVPNICGQLAGLWLSKRDPKKTELTVKVEEDGKVRWSEWEAAPQPESEASESVD